MANERLATLGFEVENGIVVACNGVGLKKLLEAGRQWLESHREQVNQLNVFPVPDGDTGTNMSLTMRSALAKIEQVADHKVGTIVGAAAEGALMGARGNSGVILSQFLQGLATGLADQTTFTATDFARATQVGRERAYQSVARPVEGTILTVIGSVSEAARQSAKTGADLTALMTSVVEAAKTAQARTPELLPVLKEAGVTDSGGQGLVYILEGGLRLMQNEPVNSEPVERPELEIAPPGLSGQLLETNYGYEVQFLIRGETLDVDRIRHQIDSLGWSTVVVGDRRLVKVHLHTQDPGRPVSYGASQGLIEEVVIENLDEQASRFMAQQTRSQSLPPVSAVSKQTPKQLGVVAVVPGAGLGAIFESLGVSRVVSGGQSHNPSVQELLEAVQQLQAENILLLPNNSNVILAAEQVQKLAPNKVWVVPTQTIPQGIAAMLSFNAQAGRADNIRQMQEASQQVRTIELTTAVRDSHLNGLAIKPGNVIGLLDNELVQAGQRYNEVVLAILAGITAETIEMITIYFGEHGLSDQAELLADAISSRYPELEIEVHEGGQPHYHYIISLE